MLQNQICGGRQTDRAAGRSLVTACLNSKLYFASSSSWNLLYIFMQFFVYLLHLIYNSSNMFIVFTLMLCFIFVGQGVVLVRSPWSDFVFTEALAQLNYVRKPCKLHKFEDTKVYFCRDCNFHISLSYIFVVKEHYYFLADNSICELLKPHISIYLDVPPSEVMDRIRKRNNVNILIALYGILSLYIVLSVPLRYI